MKNELNLTQQRTALDWIKLNKVKVFNATKDTTMACVPLGESKNDPKTWTNENWKWFCSLYMEFDYETI